MKNEVAVLYTTWPDAESAASAGRVLVAERLCACVNILGPMRSIYRWEDAVEESVEVPALFKTTADGATALKNRILALHPYDTACVLMLPVSPTASSEAFTAWVTDNVTSLSK
ncbi:divalent-cation tolerance protein CutA [Brevundimonas sp.]|uniref:divalent-cation tolerance protein CutA n=1 Tax=Brevundimonas sp. TaxID=1871086 RepID=UPI001DC1B10B|nr:divalent-cation tolerance protein CutA [Brevundimonas sp.]MBA4000112.1 divalent-cation tolerance protein CutA [Brevundimonas sp.]